MTNPKRKLNKKSRERDAGYGDGEGEPIAKPGLDVPCNHIAELFIKRGDADLATELTRHLRTPMARRVGVHRRTLRRIGAR